jgi:hypothetical protein
MPVKGDQQSTFFNENGGCADIFSLTELTLAVSNVLKSSCRLLKLGEGAWHNLARSKFLFFKQRKLISFNRYTMFYIKEMTHQV